MNLQAHEQLFNWGYHAALNGYPSDMHALEGEEAEVWEDGYNFGLEEKEKQA